MVKAREVTLAGGPIDMIIAIFPAQSARPLFGFVGFFHSICSRAFTRRYSRTIGQAEHHKDGPIFDTRGTDLAHGALEAHERHFFLLNIVPCTVSLSLFQCSLPRFRSAPQ